MDEHPTPSTSPTPEPAPAVTRDMIDSLVSTRPWVLFMGVMIMIGVGLLVLMSGLVVLFGAFAGLGTELGPGGAWFLSLVYAVLAALYFFPGLHLLRFGGAIGKIGREADTPSIELALRQQLAFWRFVGVLTIVMIVFYILIFTVGVLFGLMSRGV